MQAYGKKKRGSIHPHNKCTVCAENNINRKRDRPKINIEEIQEQHEEVSSHFEKFFDEAMAPTMQDLIEASVMRIR